MRFPFFRNRDSVKNGILISIRRTGDGFHPGLFISYFRSPRSIDITVSCSFVLRLFHIYLTLKMMQHLVALLSIIYCKKTSVLSFLVRWCWDHDQHTRLCPVLRFLNPDQITFDILNSPAHFSHNNSHTPSVPFLLEAPVHRLSVFPSIRLHEQTGRILRPQYPSDKKYKSVYCYSANPTSPLSLAFLTQNHYIYV